MERSKLELNQFRTDAYMTTRPTDEAVHSTGGSIRSQPCCRSNLIYIRNNSDPEKLRSVNEKLKNEILGLSEQMGAVLQNMKRKKIENLRQYAQSEPSDPVKGRTQFKFRKGKKTAQFVGQNQLLQSGHHQDQNHARLRLQLRQNSRARKQHQNENRPEELVGGRGAGHGPRQARARTRAHRPRRQRRREEEKGHSVFRNRPE